MARMQNTRKTNPALWQEYSAGGFTVNTSNSVPFTRLGVDQAMEHLNKVAKGHGGITGITSTAVTILKFCLTAPELAHISNEMELLAGVTSEQGDRHHGLSTSKVSYQEQSVAKLKATLRQCNIFTTEDVSPTCLYKLLTNEVVSKAVGEAILNAERLGQEAFSKYVEERINGKQNL